MKKTVCAVCLCAVLAGCATSPETNRRLTALESEMRVLKTRQMDAQQKQAQLMSTTREVLRKLSELY